jgi:hypothetical protein
MKRVRKNRFYVYQGPVTPTLLPGRLVLVERTQNGKVTVYPYLNEASRVSFVAEIVDREDLEPSEEQPTDGTIPVQRMAASEAAPEPLWVAVDEEGACITTINAPDEATAKDRLTQYLMHPDRWQLHALWVAASKRVEQTDVVE